MKSVLISIHPQWCDKIAVGRKTIEVRKTRPKIETPFKCYIYMTSGGYEWRDPWCTAVMPPSGQMYNGAQKVIGEFVCDGIIIDEHGENLDVFERCGKMSRTELTAYRATDVIGSHFKKDKRLYGWHISNLKIYDKPKEIGEFYHPCPNPEAFCEACKYAGHNPFDEEIECRAFVRCAPQSWMYVEEIK